MSIQISNADLLELINPGKGVKYDFVAFDSIGAWHQFITPIYKLVSSIFENVPK